MYLTTARFVCGFCSDKTIKALDDSGQPNLVDNVYEMGVPLFDLLGSIGEKIDSTPFFLRRVDPAIVVWR